MASIKFIFRSKKNFAPLTLRFSHKENNFKIDIFINTGFNSNREYWFDSKNKQLKYPKALSKESSEVKTKLIQLEEFIFNRFNQDFKLKNINKPWLQECIDIFFGRNKTKEEKLPTTLVGYIAHYISKAHTIKNSKGTFGLSKSRIDDFKILKKFITEFQENNIIKIIDVNLDFSNKFTNWMTKIKKYASGYAGRMLSAIKTVCNDALFHGLKVNSQLSKVTGYKTKNEFIVVLSLEELERIKHIELPLKSLENARKWLLLGCYTGQRSGDLLNINLSNFHTRNDLEVIELKQQKTSSLVTIPVLDEVKEIVNDGFPYKISQQKFNKYIKDICRLAEINELTEGFLYNKNTKRREFGKYEKWKLVSTHICRRSFCTNNFGRLPNYLIMSVTGHSSEKTFLGYIGKTSYDYAKQFKEQYEKK
ncbi:phage integrase SAM-like domain-containing protein [Tenacibaculum agarivorans]|uniref:phage integrase SAM-like domain-containing protein n=1 Tax=Tenacibaculum agarivorans TaxID=1908389 RepID=UPI00094BA45F|nr:phage integrase SAM-like domain-containing protein [Tenacibaculum agarivorans]